MQNKNHLIKKNKYESKCYNFYDTTELYEILFFRIFEDIFFDYTELKWMSSICILCIFYILTSQLGTARIFPCGFFITSGLTGRAIKDILMVGITRHENHKTCPVVKRPGNIRKVPKTWSKLRATAQHSQNCTEK